MIRPRSFFSFLTSLDRFATSTLFQRTKRHFCSDFLESFFLFQNILLFIYFSMGYRQYKRHLQLQLLRTLREFFIRRFIKRVSTFIAVELFPSTLNIYFTFREVSLWFGARLEIVPPLKKKRKKGRERERWNSDRSYKCIMKRTRNAHVRRMSGVSKKKYNRCPSPRATGRANARTSVGLNYSGNSLNIGGPMTGGRISFCHSMARFRMFSPRSRLRSVNRARGVLVHLRDVE